jgi:hypothetical protein
MEVTHYITLKRMLDALKKKGGKERKYNGRPRIIKNINVIKILYPKPPADHSCKHGNNQRDN